MYDLLFRVYGFTVRDLRIYCLGFTSFDPSIQGSGFRVYSFRFFLFR
jgi:hypothetical protein